MRAFVTGGNGFLGTHLVQQLVQDGWQVTVLHRQTSDLSELKKLPGIQYVLGDVNDAASLERGIPKGVDVLFHVAGSVGLLPQHEKSRFDTNQIGTRNVVQASFKQQVQKIIYTSTVLTYDFRAQQPVTEKNPANLWSEDTYIKSKRLADQEMQVGLQAGLPVVFVHPTAMFGAYDKATWSKMFREIHRGLALPIAPPGRANVCHARPVAKAHIQAAHRGTVGEHYILGGPEVTWLQVMQEIALIMRKSGPTMTVAPWMFRTYGWAEYLFSSLLRREPLLTPHTINLLGEPICCDSSKAEQELQYRSTTLREMLDDCYQWMLREKYFDPS